MKNSTKIRFAIAVVLWIIATVLLFKNSSPHAPFIVILTGVIIIIGFVTQIRKKVNNE